MKLYSPTIDRDGNPGSQLSPWRPEIDWPSIEDFAPGDPDGSQTTLDLARTEKIKEYETFLRNKAEAEANVRREREEAHIAGTLSGDAEVFRDLTLKPRLREIHEYEQTVKTPIVQGLLFRNTLAWVAGSSGTFKSFITADLAFRYGAEDMEYHGKRMTHGRTLLVIAEGAAGYADRRAAWEKQHEREVKQVVIYPAPLQLGDTLKEMPALLSYLKEEDAAGRAFGLVVFDTQAMCTVGIDENTSEVNLVINVLHRIREVSGACVLTVHHFGKSEKSGLRGSSMLYAAADTVIVVAREKEGMGVTLSTGGDNGKQKDAIAEVDLLSLELVPHVVGTDFFEDPLTSLVPVAVSAQSHDDHEEHPEVPDYLPDVTVDQMFYLKLLAFYEGRGGTPADMASKLEETRGPMRNGRQNIRNRMIELAKLSPPLAAQPTAKGPWVITAMGTATIARQVALGDRWVELSGPRKRRKPVDNPVDNLLSHQVSGGSAKPTTETSET